MQTRTRQTDPADGVHGTDRADLGRWAKHGAIGGLLAGLLFALFEMVMATVQMGGEAFFMPLRMIGGIALGSQALEPSSTSLLEAGGAGIAIHMMLSVIFGASVAVAAGLVPPIRSSTIALVAWTSLAGLIMWLVNFYVIAPIGGWRWFPDGTDPVIQFIAHTFVFGSLLGLYLDRTVRTLRSQPQLSRG
ncbi:MAG: hypothetical protein M3432_01725 [Chloroflexota bacterium]|nr:hypothetical protein [Chloroflexota bacterium]